MYHCLNQTWVNCIVVKPKYISMATSGRIDFDRLTLTSDVRLWLERFEHFVTAHNLFQSILTTDDADVQNSKKKKNTSIFCSLLDSNTYSLLKSLVSPERVDSKPFDELKTLLENHLAPKATKYAQRYRFHRTTQLKEECANLYLSRLRKVANDCQFNQNYDDRLLDQFLMGLYDSRAQAKLLQTANLTLATAVTKVLTDEKARQEAQIMGHGGGKSESVNALRMKQKKKKFSTAKPSDSKPFKVSSGNNSNLVCGQCTLKGHSANQCVVKCRSCQQKGHIRKNCPHKKKKFKKKQFSTLHLVDSDSSSYYDSDDDVEENMANIDAFLYYTDVCDTNDQRYESVQNCANDLNDLCDSQGLYGIDGELIKFNNVNTKIDLLPNFNSYDIFGLTDHDLDNVLSEMNIAIELIDKYELQYPKSPCIDSELAVELQHTVDLQLHNAEVIEIHHNSVNARLTIPVKINNSTVNMEFDSGATVSVCSRELLRRVGCSVSFLSTSKSLRAASGQVTPACARAYVDVEFNGQVIRQLELFVVDGRFPALFGNSWIKRFLGDNWLDTLMTMKRTNSELQNPDDEVDSCDLVSDVATVKQVDQHGKDRDVPKDPNLCSVCNSSVCQCPSSSNVVVCSEELSSTCCSGQSCSDQAVVQVSVPSVRFPFFSHSEISDKDQKTEEKLIAHVSEPLISVNSLKPTSNKASHLRSVEELKKSVVFDPGIGLVKGIRANLVVKKDAVPVTFKARPLPFAMRKRVEDELENMVKAKILFKVKDSPWSSPIVPVLKGDKIRICGDYKVSLNKVLDMRQHPLPNLEDCFAAVTGGKKFSVIDIKKAYNNIELREEDKLLTTISTHKGLYAWNRLCYGVNSSGPIFQSVIDDTLLGCKMTCCRVDDILISGRTDKEHLANLNDVIRRLEERGFRCNLEKTKIMQDEVIYLGHRVTKDGISPIKSRVADLLKAPVPKNKDELVSFLGAVNYYRRYLANLSNVIASLERLRGKNVKWIWGDKEQQAYDKMKQLLSSSNVLTFYSPELPLRLDTDASSVGLGAVLSHVMKDGSERPIEYISRTLSAAEKNYSQIDREALGIVWAVKRFHLYLYGRNFKLVSDHQPLVHIFNKNRRIPDMSSARVTRWAIFLMNYDFDIEYRPTKQHANCDMLSRLPRETRHSLEEDECAEVFEVQLEDTYLNASLVAAETRKDLVLSKVMTYILDGWPKQLESKNEEMMSYFNRRFELSTERNCVTWGCRVVIPGKLRKPVLDMLHATHIGMTGMKQLARSYVWWTNLNLQIEQICRSCESCGIHGKRLPRVIDHPWTRASGPWQRIHIDYAGPFLGNFWLIVYDSYSKWPEVVRMNQKSTSTATITALRRIFSHNGIPVVLVSDNGRSFVSEEFEKFITSQNINHVLTATYSPKSNGICEKFVDTFKSSMKKMYESSKDLDKNLANFLLNYRNTPHSTTKVAPSVAMFNRTLRSRLHQIRPDDQEKVESFQSQKEQKLIDAPAVRQRQFQPNEKVWILPTNEKKWQKATVKQRINNSNLYDVNLDGRIVRKHADSIKSDLKPVIQLRKSPMPKDQEVSVRKYVNMSQSQLQPNVRSGHEVKSRLSVDQGTCVVQSNVDQSKLGECPKSVQSTPDLSISHPSTPYQAHVNQNPAPSVPATDIVRRTSARIASKPAINYKE